MFACSRAAPLRVSCFQGQAHLQGVAKVKVSIKGCKTRFGENVALVGSFCSWDPAAATPLSWSDGGVWTAECELPVGQEVSYKFIVKGKDAEADVTWQPCPNLTLTLADGTKTVLVLDDWLGKTHEVQPVEVEEAEEEEAEAASEEPATAAAVPVVAEAAAAAAVEIPVVEKEEAAVAFVAVEEEEELTASATEVAPALLPKAQPVAWVVAAEEVLAAAPAPSPLAAAAAFQHAAPTSSSSSSTTKAATGKRSGAAQLAGPKAPKAPKASSQPTVKDLKAQLQALGLSVAGRKEELVARLKQAAEL